MEQPYTYIFIRTDLSYAQQIVQASHATLEAGFKFDQPDQTSAIVLFGVKSEAELFEKAKHLRKHSIEHVMFYEPDIEQYTAIASKPLRGLDREALGEFRTYRPKADKKWWKRLINA